MFVWANPVGPCASILAMAAVGDGGGAAADSAPDSVTDGPPHALSSTPSASTAASRSTAATAEEVRCERASGIGWFSMV
jgi:hypothetical protein